MLRFASLGSGSRGNATLVQALETTVLVDCGYSVRELARRCRRLAIDPAQLDGLLVTHEHADHIKGVAAVARRFSLTVWMTHGTWLGAGCPDFPDLRLFDGHSGELWIDSLRVQPYPVPHDAREPVQFVFECRDKRFGMLTDIGSLTPHVIAMLKGVDGLLLECNHDRQMLANGPYPPSLQVRVGGDFGHLANAQSATLLQHVNCERLRHLVGGHISQKNNAPALVREAIAEVSTDLRDRMHLLAQDETSAWYAL
jgi:phosphoribosyl 1,2-cyclic phosphodiesterase